MSTPTLTPPQLDQASSSPDTNYNPPVGGPAQKDPTGGLSKQDQVELLSWVNSSFTKMKQARSYQERQWYMNMAFFFGKQNVQLLTTTASTNGFKLNTPPAPPWRVRLVINKIRPIIRTELAKLYSQKPRFTVVPATTEDEDLAAQRAAEQILDSVYENKQCKRIFRSAGWWASICGTSFIKDYWNPDEIDKFSDQKGDFCIEAVTPFHVFVPDLRSEALEDQPYLIHATTKSPEWVKATFGNSVTPNVKATDEILEDGFLNLIGAQNQQADKVLVLEVWIKPKAHKLFPQGGLVTVVGGQLAVVQTNYPYRHGEFPFAKLDRIPSGKFYGDSVIVDLIPIQREYNRTRSQVIENKNLMGKVKIIAARGSIQPEKITSEPGQAILFTAGFPAPTVVAPPPLPNYIIQEIQQLQSDLDDISGQHQVSRGENPSQVTSATALSFLQEQDDTMLSDGVDSLESAVQTVGRHILYYATQFWNTARLVKVVGTDGAFEAKRYKGDELRGNHDVRVEAGSALPKSKAAKQAFLMDLMKMGFVQPETGLELLDLGGIEKVFDELRVDVRQAQRENLRLADGEAIPSNDYDNHAAHVATHDKYRKTQQFEALSEDVRILFNEHVNMHKIAAGIPVNEPGKPVAAQNNDMPAPVGAGGSGNPGAPPPPDALIGAGGPPPPPMPMPNGPPSGGM